jgi:hypothetical protein
LTAEALENMAEGTALAPVVGSKDGCKEKRYCDGALVRSIDGISDNFEEGAGEIDGTGDGGAVRVGWMVVGNDGTGVKSDRIPSSEATNIPNCSVRNFPSIKRRTVSAVALPKYTIANPLPKKQQTTSKNV